MGTAVPPPLQLLHFMYPVFEQVEQPTSPSFQRVHMHSSTPEPPHLGHASRSPASCSFCHSESLPARYQAAAPASTVVTAMLPSPRPRAFAATVVRLLCCGRRQGHTDTVLLIAGLVALLMGLMPAALLMPARLAIAAFTPLTQQGAHARHRPLCTVACWDAD